MSPLIIPTDTPDYSRDYLSSLDGTITTWAREYHGGDSDEARLVVGRLWHARADGANAFFLFHWLHLFEEQAEARVAGKPLPVQTWVMPGIRGIAA